LEDIAHKYHGSGRKASRQEKQPLQLQAWEQKPLYQRDMHMKTENKNRCQNRQLRALTSLASANYKRATKQRGKGRQ